MINLTEKIRRFLKIEEALSDKRDHHIDALKGLTIMLVLIGHSVQISDVNFDNNLLFRVIYSFHMPMFMFLSGFILLTQFGYSFLNYIKKNTVRLVVPFLFWYFISYVIVCFHHDVSFVAYFLDLAKSPGRGLWFLWVLFLNSTLLFGALKLARYKNQQHRENYFVIGAILLSMVFSSDFLALADVKQYFPYYATGFFVSKYRDAFKGRKKMIYAICLVAFPLLVLGWKRNDLPLFYPALLQFIDNQPIARLIVSIYKYAVAFTGFGFCSFWLDSIRKTRLFLVFCWLGIFTLDIYVCHSYFLIGFGRGVIQYFSAAFIAMVLSLALTILIMKRFKITRLLLLGQRS
jgi:fucose 4-O-acetylase-like acetyltransferase